MFIFYGFLDTNVCARSKIILHTVDTGILVGNHIHVVSELIGPLYQHESARGCLRDITNVSVNLL